MLRVIFLILLLSQAAQAQTVQFSGSPAYSAPLPSPGTPCAGAISVSCNFITGRTSSNPLKRYAISTGTAITEISTSTVSVGTGTKIFTIDLSKGSYGTNDNITIASAVDAANQQMSGTVTSLVGTTLTLNVTSKIGSVTASDWELLTHLPSGWFLSGASVRARTGDSIDWDFRGMPANVRIDGTTFLTISQSLFDACGLPTDINAALIDNRSATSWSGDHNELDGCGYTGRLTRMVGSDASGPAPILFEYNKITNAPLDVISGITGSSSFAKSTFRYNYLQSTCTTALAFGLHVDIFQLVGWDLSDLEIYNNVAAIQCSDPVTGSTTTSPFNIGLSASFTGDAYTHDNVAYGGGYTAITSGSGSGTLRYNNIWLQDATFQSDGNGNGGFLNPNAPAYTSLTVTNIFSNKNGAQLNFRWNNAGVTTTVTHIP